MVQAFIYFKEHSSQHAAVNKYFSQKNEMLSINTDNVNVYNIQA